MIRRLLILTLSLAATGAQAQALPRISALYPPGGRAGSTVEVAIRGGGLEGAREVIVDGAGLSATLNAADVKVDPADQKVFQSKCSQCHELRGPATISRTADQWVATVDRMIKEKGAPIETADRAKIVSYVQADARAAAGLTARVTVAADAAPGRRELRVVAANGTSTAFPFEVTTQPEALEVEPNDVPDKAPPVTLPVTVSGQIGAGDVDSFAFEAKQGERLVFNCNAYRLNAASQAYFFPVLRLLNDKGKELAKNNGYFSLDPLIDWTAPADGRYIVQIRDMLYRGSPATIYRLSMGALPYKTYLYPPGSRRGESTTVHLSGENMEATSLSVQTAANEPVGVRQLSTGFGAFPFAAGDYPEFVETAETPPGPVTLPISLNGRISAAREEDRYAFTLNQEQLGAYSFEMLAERLGSPLVGKLTLRNARGQVLATNNGGQGSRDPRLDYTFQQPGEYTLGVTDAAEKFGPTYVYRVSAGPAAPDFRLTISPDNPNLGPGSSVYLTVKVQRRVGVAGNIEVSFPKLPPGVTATPAFIRPDQNEAFVILTAAPNAKPGTFALAGAVGTATVQGQALTRDLIPYEIYRINNNPQTEYRKTMVVTVGPEGGWTVSLEPSGTRLSPESGPVKVTARLNRHGMEGDLPFAITGIPPGVQGPQNLLFKRGVDELTFTLTPTSGGLFAARGAGQPPLPPHVLLAIVNGREGEGMMMSSPALALLLGAATSAAR
jgi:hypothetical protein